MSDDDEEFPLQQHLVEPVVATTPNCIVGTISIANQTRKKQQQSKQRERDTEITNRVHRHNNRKGKCKRGKKATCTKKASPPTNHHMEEALLENFDSNKDINFEDGDDEKNILVPFLYLDGKHHPLGRISTRRLQQLGMAQHRKKDMKQKATATAMVMRRMVGCQLLQNL